MFISIGSCRVNNPLLTCKLKNLDYHIPEFYTHSTKEVIQMIEFLQKKNNFSLYDCKFKNKLCLQDDDVLIIEICSKKIFYKEEGDSKMYMTNNLYEQMDDKTDKFKNYKQTDDEIINDLNIITKMVNCRVIFVGHIIPPISDNIINNTEWLKHLYKSRNHLNAILYDFCLSKNEKHISYCDINKLFKLYKPEDILEIKDNNIIKLDLNHYKPEKFEFIGKFLTNDIFLHNSSCFFYVV